MVVKQTTHHSGATIQVQTDASKTGWGAHLEHQVIQGRWQAHETSMHINVLEMRAVIETCRKCSEQFRGQSVLFLIDNVAVVAHINKQGEHTLNC